MITPATIGERGRVHVPADFRSLIDEKGGEEGGIIRLKSLPSIEEEGTHFALIIQLASTFSEKIKRMRDSGAPFEDILLQEASWMGEYEVDKQGRLSSKFLLKLFESELSPKDLHGEVLFFINGLADNIVNVVRKETFEIMRN